MRKWKSHKIVEAEQITDIVNTMSVKSITVTGVGLLAESIEVTDTFFIRGMPQLGDYLIRYDNGFLSWSPKKAFEGSYTLLGDDDINEASLETVKIEIPDGVALRSMAHPGSQPSIAPDDAFALMCMTAHRIGTIIDQPWAFEKAAISERLVPLLTEFDWHAETVKDALREWGFIK